MTDAKRPASVVVQGLETTADKIRALAIEGYLRVEIAAFLDIRYQHARGVMLSAGITDGLSRGGSTVVVEKPKSRTTAAPSKPDRAPWKPTPISVLTDGGFVKLGEWQVTEEGTIALSAPAPRDPGVYAFATDGIVRYVGLTRAGFHKRMGNYRSGNPQQRTSHRINRVILEQVSAGTVVEIYLATPPAIDWSGLPINAAAGLEAGLIDLIQPPWNMMGVEIQRGV